jgi:hypothetical protein
MRVTVQFRSIGEPQTIGVASKSTTPTTVSAPVRSTSAFSPEKRSSDLRQRY